MTEVIFPPFLILFLAREKHVGDLGHALDGEPPFLGECAVRTSPPHFIKDNWPQLKKRGTTTNRQTHCFSLPQEREVFFHREREREKKTQFLEREIVWLWGFGLGFSFLLGGDNRDCVFLEGDNSHGTFWNYLFIFSSSLFLEGVVIGLGCVVVALSDCKFDGFCLVS